MRIAYVSLGSPFDLTAWSGIPFHTYREIKRRFPDTHAIDTPLTDRLLKRAAYLERHGLLFSREPLIATKFLQHVNSQLERLKPDAVLAIGAAHKVAYIRQNWPLVYIADAMFGTVVSYYEKYVRLSARSLRNGEQVQRELVSRANMILLASEWAVSSAIERYAVSPSRIRVAPFGANLDTDPGYTAPRSSGPINLLFVGYDWKRKNGEVAVRVWQELRMRTKDAILHIVGSDPPGLCGIEGVVVHGTLRKNVPAEREALDRLFRGASFFIMPSHQEAFGIVFCEAAAYGRPSIGTRTGGITTAVEDGVTGVLLPPNAHPRDFADQILEIWNNPETYTTMCLSARHAYETRLNWQAWGDSVTDALKRAVEGKLAGDKHDRAEALPSPF